VFGFRVSGCVAPTQLAWKNTSSRTIAYLDVCVSINYQSAPKTNRAICEVHCEGIGTVLNSRSTTSQKVSEADSYLRLIDFVHHSTLGLSVMKKKDLRETHEEVRRGHGHLWFGAWA